MEIFLHEILQDLMYRIDLSIELTFYSSLRFHTFNEQNALKKWPLRPWEAKG